MSPQRFLKLFGNFLSFLFFPIVSEHGLTNNVKAEFQVSRGICAVFFVSNLEVEGNITGKPREKCLHIKLMILLGKNITLVITTGCNLNIKVSIFHCLS